MSGGLIRNARFLLSLPKWNNKQVPRLPEICFAGRSNVGKSTLINTLTNRKNLAKTSSTPGRTQALVVFEGEIAGNQGVQPLVMVDLPGYGWAKVPPSLKESWRPMMESYFSGNDRLAATLFLLDIRRNPKEEDLELLEMLEEFEIPVMPIITKADKVAKGKRSGRLKEIARELELEDWRDLWPVSASERTGMGEICEQLFELVAAKAEEISANSESEAAESEISEN